MSMCKTLAATILAGTMLFAGSAAAADKAPSGTASSKDGKAMELVQEWDKVFPRSDKVEHRKVTFRTRYGTVLAGDLYVPRGAKGKLAALAVSGPFGAVKEQASGLYAQTMAERGFLTLAFDPSYTGESSGEPRHVASPDINTEDFSAAVDFLTTLDAVDAERIGIIGICGFGGMGLNAAAMDTRIKATVAVTMYDMSRVTANGYFDAMDAEARYALRQQLNAQRTRRQHRTVRRGPARGPDGRRAAVRQGLLRLLQDQARLPSPFHQLQWCLERHLGPVLPEHAVAGLCGRDPQRGPAGPRGKGPFPLLQRGCLQEAQR